MEVLHRAVDRLGCMVDFLLTARRAEAAARRFFDRAIDRHNLPRTFTIDKIGANTGALRSLLDDSGMRIELRQSRYLNNVVEQNHCAVNGRTRPLLNFKSFQSANKLIGGIERMHMITNGQLQCPGGQAFSGAD